LYRGIHNIKQNNKLIKQNKTMKSLTTDDILGARPKIRHAPRNLIRDQRIAQQPSHNPYST
jgi:hypothetical protein